MGSQLDRGVGDGDTPKRSRGFAKKKRRCGEEGDQKKVIIDLTEQEEEKEEKEKEGIKEAGSRGVEGSREAKVRRENSCKESYGRTLPGHWPGPLVEEPQEDLEAGEEEVEEDARVFFQQRLLDIYNIEWVRGRECLGGPQQTSPHSGHSPWSAGCPRDLQYERVFDTGGWHGVGRGQAVPTPPVGVVPQDLHGRSPIWRSESRIFDSVLDRRPFTARKGFGSNGCFGAAAQVARADCRGHELGNEPEARARASADCFDRRSLRNTGGPQRGEARPAGSPLRLCLRERKNERQREGQGQDKRQGQGQVKGGRPQEAGGMKESEGAEDRYEAPRGVEAGGSQGVLPKKVEACGSPEVLPRREAAEDQDENKGGFLPGVAKKKKVAEMRRGQADSAQKRGLEGRISQKRASKKIQKTWRRLQRKKDREEKKKLRSYDASERGEWSDSRLLRNFCRR